MQQDLLYIHIGGYPDISDVERYADAYFFRKSYVYDEMHTYKKYKLTIKIKFVKYIKQIMKAGCIFMQYGVLLKNFRKEVKIPRIKREDLIEEILTLYPQISGGDLENAEEKFYQEDDLEHISHSTDEIISHPRVKFAWKTVKGVGKKIVYHVPEVETSSIFSKRILEQKNVIQIGRSIYCLETFLVPNHITLDLTKIDSAEKKDEAKKALGYAINLLHIQLLDLHARSCDSYISGRHYSYMKVKGDYTSQSVLPCDHNMYPLLARNNNWEVAVVEKNQEAYTFIMSMLGNHDFDSSGFVNFLCAAATGEDSEHLGLSLQVQDLLIKIGL